MASVFTFTVLFLFWILWSGKFDLFHLALGVISTTIVTLWSKDLLIKDHQTPVSKRLRSIVQLEKYSFWLLWQIIIANCQVVYVSLHPNMKSLITSKMVDFKVTYSSEMTQFILAQSITLTPGTVTVRIKNNEFLVHALTQKAADAVPGEMVKRVGDIMGEQA